MELKIPTRVQGLESLAQYGGGVFEAGNESTTMDIVKFVRKIPLVFCIVNLKATIGGNTLLSAEIQTTGEVYQL